ncbi:MAG: putative MAP kinase kinase family domain protein [Streblomastix strix]|uniref:non-specific serine/threonine protein kinase n=1 Tax=Streblomastix strix TaxID=222440 RepID=A0A5J4X348_9EUKA|nr:MAG: putative MAP kinase kinase family domain protein [Streblomastix strix]
MKSSSSHHSGSSTSATQINIVQVKEQIDKTKGKEKLIMKESEIRKDKLKEEQKYKAKVREKEQENPNLKKKDKLKEEQKYKAKVREKEQENPNLKKKDKLMKMENDKEKDISSKSGCLCTINRNIDIQYFKQKAYECLTCKLEDESYVCKNCAETCHRGHNLKPMGILDIYCDCPFECPEESDIEKNAAQNQEADQQLKIELINSELVEPKYQDFEIVKKLFGGAMGNTFLVMLKLTSVLYVMKRVDYLDEGDKKLADEEVEQMRRLSSKFTVRLMWTFVDRTDLYLISEYCSRGDLRKHIAELQCLPEEERLNHVYELFTQIILSLNFMHSKGIIHRDIKPENIFLMEDGSVRLGDFGLSKFLNKANYATIAGTKMFFQTDVYSCGIVFCEILLGFHPLLAENEKATIDNIINGKIVELPNWVPTEIKELVMNMMNVDYSKRPTTQALMKEQIIKQNIELLEIQLKKKEEELKKKQRTTEVSAINPELVSYQQIKELSNYIEYLQKSELTDEENFNKLPEQLMINTFQKLSDCLYAARSIQTVKGQKISGKTCRDLLLDQNRC